MSGPGADWRDWDAAGAHLLARFDGLYTSRTFEYRQPLRLQREVPRRLRRPYAVPVAYTDWGAPEAPLLLCCGGVANTAMRFAFLAADLQRAGWRVVCMDWLGRGLSGWLADASEYGLPTCVEQMRQMLDHLGRPSVAVLGSSLGGSAAIELAARDPKRVGALVLNDVGPHIPLARRRRRAQTLARHYVFRNPADIDRRVGAAQKNDGPASNDVRHFLAHYQTRWSEPDQGRIYRHDPRAMLAYRRDAEHPFEQWSAWSRVRCPVLLLRGMLTDALWPSTVARMRREHPLALAHVPRTGHTPLLCDRNQNQCVLDWLRGELSGALEFSIPIAGRRSEAEWS